ncbi:hypothetical protein JTE90_020560 [Oedothorax gibbosus]|uniref:Uncharacterized protein n=1 Tax=Oedothorax gibbosus TaxID=931172 RepID=A0AAV6VWW1_9ARAC|nr:hypothetical protein JTE90_020560 [Oedothorax gibbosus]
MPLFPIPPPTPANKTKANEKQQQQQKNGKFDRDYIPPNASHFGILSQSPGMIDGADLRFQGFKSVSRAALCGFKCNHSLQRRTLPFSDDVFLSLLGLFFFF